MSAARLRAGQVVPELAVPPGAVVVGGASMSVARSAAVIGSAHPVSGSNVIVDGRPPSPTGLNTYTGPRSARSGAVRSSRSVRVLVTSTAPGASITRPASHWVLPTRGPPNAATTSSIDDHTRRAPTRQSSTPTSVGGRRRIRVSQARRPGTAREGRTIGARRRIASVPPTLTMSVLDATPALRRLVAPQRVTVADGAHAVLPDQPAPDEREQDQQPRR